METIERALADEGPLSGEQLKRAPRGRRRADRGPGAHPPDVPRGPARHRRARPDGRQAARLRRSSATGSVRSGRSTATRHWPSWPAATSSATARPTTATWRRWAGLPLRDARAGLGAIASELVEREDGLVDLAKRPPAEPHPAPRLLGAFDPLLLGWTSREEVVGPHKQLVTINGIFRPFALVDGRAVATWRLTRGKVTIEPLGRVTKKAAAALEADAGAVEGFMAGTENNEGSEMGQPVVHFEVVGKDGDKLQSYYAEMFDWEVNADNQMKYGLVEPPRARRASASAAASARAPRATRATSPSTSKSPTSRRRWPRPRASAAPG